MVTGFASPVLDITRGEIEVIDSLFEKRPQKAVKQVASLVHSTLPALTLKFLNTQNQCGSSDCGLYAIATATAVCKGAAVRHWRISRPQADKPLLDLR